MLVSLAVDDGDSMLTAIVDAFATTGVAVDRTDTRVNDWVDMDALVDFLEHSGPDSFVYTRIWDRPVTVTASRVTVYSRDPR